MSELDAVQRRTFERASATTRESWPEGTRMTGAAMAAVLDARPYAVIASSRPDGRPHVAPGGFVALDAEIWLPTAAGAVRRHNAAANPWLALTICEGEDEQHAVLIVEGPAQEVALADAPDQAHSRYQAKYHQSVDWAGCWLVLTAERVLSHHGADWHPDA